MDKNLNPKISGDIRTDLKTRMIYGTDASIYQIIPIGVAFPKSKDDLQQIMSYAFDKEISITPRGGGTSLGGQTVGEGLIIDFSMYMNKVLDFNPEENWVEVQPGIILDELNKYMEHALSLIHISEPTRRRGSS